MELTEKSNAFDACVAAYVACAVLADEADVKGTAEWVQLIGDDEGPASRNAASLVPVGKDTLLLTGGWRPFVETYDDTWALPL